MAMRDKIEHAIQNQPCTVKDLKNKFGGDRGADRKVMEAVDQLVHEAVICQRQGVFFTVRSGRADKALLCKVVKLGKNFAFDVGGLAYHQLSLGIDCSVECTVDTDIGARGHQTGNLGALGDPAQLIGLWDYFCFCHNINCLTVDTTDGYILREMPRRPPLSPRSW